MKPSAAIVQKAVVNIDLLAEQIIVALGDERHADSSARRHAQLGEAAAEAARIKRVEIGRLLAKARGVWPERGKPPAGVKGSWSEFLARVGMSQVTAWKYMELAGFVANHPREDGTPTPTQREAGIDKRPLSGDRREQPDPPVREVTEAEVTAFMAKQNPTDRARILKTWRPANVSGGSGETDRGSWCTSKLWAERVGSWDLDPFSNPRSHIVSERRCMLEDGGNGLLDLAVPGSYSAPPKFGRADETTRVWIQPPYSILERVIEHYGHTRFCALLRLDSSTEWFAALWERTKVIALAKGTREFFEPPPNTPSSTNPQPHALYYSDPRDITPAIAESCIVLTRYQAQAQPALHIVR